MSGPMRNVGGLGLIVTLLFTGCLTNVGQLSTFTKKTLSLPPSSATDTSSIVISSARDHFDDPNLVAVIGDGSSTLGDYCYDPAVLGAGIGPTTCECVFRSLVNNSLNEVRAPTKLHEGNMVACDKSYIPSGATNIEVALYQTAIDAKSNYVTYSVSGVSATTVDLSSTASFVQVQKHYTMDINFVPLAMDGSMYDPFQSVDTRFAITRIFYTSDPGRTLLAIASNSSQNVNLSKYYYSLASNTVPANVNTNIYSVDPDSSGVYRVASSVPTGSAYDRQLFYLSKVKTSVYSVPINAFIAPGLKTVTPSLSGQPPKTEPPLGWAARATVASDGSVTCNIAAKDRPAGWTVELLTLWRASLPPRKIVRTTNDISAYQQIYCNPGRWTVAPTVARASRDEEIAKDCALNTAGTFTNQHPLDNPHPTTGLAARVFGKSEVCVSYPTDSQARGAPWTNNGKAGQASIVQSTNFIEGSDYVERVGDTTNGNTNAGKFNFFEPPYADAATANRFDKGDQTTPYSKNIVLGDLDLGGQSSDMYIFMVSPVTTNVLALQNESTGSGPYRPYMYLRSEDCDAAVPDSDATCLNASGRKVIFHFFEKEMGSTPSSALQNTYPACIVRPPT